MTTVRVFTRKPGEKRWHAMWAYRTEADARAAVSDYKASDTMLRRLEYKIRITERKHTDVRL